MGAHNSQTINMVNMLLLINLLVQVSLLLALPTSTEPGVDQRIVNRPDQQRQSPAITGSLVQDVKQINILLNIPNGCNAIYDSMIGQLERCRNSKLSFPADDETPWHPDPTCNGEYCQESSNLEFTGREVEDSNVDFPDEVKGPY